MIQVLNIHKNPHYWPDPEEFRPERFDTRVSPPIHPNSFHPFGGGPRYDIVVNAQLEEFV
jgi:cytochrome P450